MEKIWVIGINIDNVGRKGKFLDIHQILSIQSSDSGRFEWNGKEKYGRIVIIAGKT